MTPDIFRVGIIANTHGIAGDVKVIPTTEDSRRFFQLKDVLIGNDRAGAELVPATVAGVRFSKGCAIVSFKEFNNINDVARFKGQDLFVTRENAIPLEEGEYYIKDMIGLKVYTDSGEFLGILKNVLETGANSVYEISMEGRKDLLVPMIPECSRGVNLKDQTLTLHLLPGLLEL